MRERQGQVSEWDGNQWVDGGGSRKCGMRMGGSRKCGMRMGGSKMWDGGGSRKCGMRMGGSKMWHGNGWMWVGR